MRKASVTVEAAFIVPIVVWIIFVFICQALIQSDRVIIEMTVDRVLEEVVSGEVVKGNSQTNSRNLIETINVDIKEKLSDMVMVHSIEEVNFRENGEEFEIDVFVKSRLNINYLADNSEYCVNRGIGKEKICSWIRRLKVVKD